MNKHFCRVGKIRSSLSELLDFKDIETKIVNFAEDATNLDAPRDLNASF